MFKKEIKMFDFKSSKVENCVFIKVINDFKVLVACYVVDLLIYCIINETNSYLTIAFDIKDLYLVAAC